MLAIGQQGRRGGVMSAAGRCEHHEDVESWWWWALASHLAFSLPAHGGKSQELVTTLGSHRRISRLEL